MNKYKNQNRPSVPFLVFRQFDLNSVRVEKIQATALQTSIQNIEKEMTSRLTQEYINI